MGMRSSSGGGNANWINVSYCAAAGVLHVNDERTKALIDAAKQAADEFKQSETLSYDGDKVTSTMRECLADAGVLARNAAGRPLEVEIEGNLDYVALDPRTHQGKELEYFKFVLSDVREDGVVDKYSISFDFNSTLAQQLIPKLLSAKPKQRVLFKPVPMINENEQTGIKYVTHACTLNDVATGSRIEKPATFKDEVTAVVDAAKAKLQKAGLDDPKVIKATVNGARANYYRELVSTLVERFKSANGDNRKEGQDSRPESVSAANAAPQQRTGSAGQSNSGGYQRPAQSGNSGYGGIPGRQQPQRAAQPVTVADLDDDIPFGFTKKTV